MKDRKGIALIYVIGAIVALSAIAAAITKLTPSATITEINQNKFGQAYYAAYSGLNYAMTLTDTELGAISGSEKTLSLNDTAKFTLIVGEKSGTTYPVRSVGSTKENESSYFMGPVDIAPQELIISSGTPITTTSSDQSVESEASVDGDMVAKSFMLKSKASVAGSLYSKEDISIEQDAVLTGDGCTREGDLVLKNGASIIGNVNINGDVTLESSSKITGEVRLTGELTLKNDSWIKGDVYLPLGFSGIKNNGGKIYTTSGAECGASCVHASSSAVSCEEISTPNPSVVTGATQSLVLEQGQSNFSNPLKNNTYKYTSIMIKNGAKLYIDISGGNPVSIEVAGDVNIESSDQGDYKNVLIKTAKSGEFVSIDELIASKDFDAASLVYLKSDGTVNIKHNEMWYGTIFARNQINLEQGVKVVGAYASPGQINIKHQVELVKYVLAQKAW